MNSFLFCTCYINKNSMNCHPLRYEKWISYYTRLMEALDVEYIFLIDDGSTDPAMKNIANIDIHFAEEALPDTLSHKVNIITFKKHLGRPAVLDYPGWWRSFTYSIEIAKKYGFEKIIHIESDFYIVSERLIRFIQTLDTGWTSLYSGYWNFPETAIQIICGDNFHAFESVRSRLKAANYNFQQMAELFLPFTNVCKKFTGDRLGEIVVLKQWMANKTSLNELDYYGQLPIFARPFSAPEFRQLMHSIATTVNTADKLNQDLLIKVLEKNDMIIAPS